jgi:hypothetical protein
MSPDFLPYMSTRHSQEYLNNIDSLALSIAILKANGVGNGIVGNSSDYDSPKKIQNKSEWEEFEQVRRAIWPESNYFNTLGMPRSDFTKSDNDDLAENAYYAVCEKAIMDYLSTMNWTVVDDKEENVDDAIDFLKHPNSQEYFDDVIRESLRDLLRYDAAAWVKTFNRDGTLAEFKPFDGTEFWAEIDRRSVGGYTAGLPFVGWYSKGFVVHWWQRSRTGLYISFVPDEIAYMRMYRRSDSVYGTDFISRLKWQIQYLIDSTRAAGKTFSNGVVPSIVWEHPQIFDQNQLYQRMMEVKKENQGSYRFGSVLHTVRDEKVTSLSHTLHDMQWLEGQQLVAKIVWSMFGFQPEEFSGDSSNRATAYVSRNVTKSKMLYPLMKFYERTINNDILPFVEGYNKKWKFKFAVELDLDDELKQAQILATKVQTANMLRSIGVKAEDALKLTKVTDKPETLEIEDIPLTMDTMPKQPVKDRAGALEGSQHKPTKEIPFGDKEERQAGINKAEVKEHNREGYKLRKNK